MGQKISYRCLPDRRSFKLGQYLLHGIIKSDFGALAQEQNGCGSRQWFGERGEVVDGGGLYAKAWRL
jgi:hypothetical protein